MRLRYCCTLLLFHLLLWPCARGQGAGGQSGSPDATSFPSGNPQVAKVPAGVILVKGAWWSISDSDTLVPEAGGVTRGVFSDPYFGMTYALPPGWTEKYKGPPPSDSGRYVLAQISPAEGFQGPDRGTMLITAQDMFFTTAPASNAAELMNYMRDHLQPDYRVEMPPAETSIAGRRFVSFAYWSPIAGLHWYVFSTEIRCHAVQIVLASRSTQLLASLIRDMNRMRLPEGAEPSGKPGDGAFPACIDNYARNENVVARVNPVFTEHRYNPVPVRIIIGKQGRVEHIHFISAFPDQAKAISDALSRWKFKPYLRDGKPAEVETGILFGRGLRTSTPQPAGSTNE